MKDVLSLLYCDSKVAFAAISLQVGIQRALLRDAAHVFCYLAVSSIHSFRRERALASGLPVPPSQPVTADDVEAFCHEVFGSGAPSPSDRSVEPSSSAVSISYEATLATVVRCVTLRLISCVSGELRLWMRLGKRPLIPRMRFGVQDVFVPIMRLMLELQKAVYAPGELLEILTSRLIDQRVAERLTPHFPSIAALRLYGQRVSATTVGGHSSVWVEGQVDAHAALDDACMSFLSFAEAASRVLQQPKILSDAVRSQHKLT